MSSSSPPPRQLLTPPQDTDSTSQPPLPPTTDPSSPTPSHRQPTTSTTSLSEWQVYRATNDHQSGAHSIQHLNNSETNEIDSVSLIANFLRHLTSKPS